eukprot:6182762-Pleurochrysis_carterae.AAC.1
MTGFAQLLRRHTHRLLQIRGWRALWSRVRILLGLRSSVLERVWAGGLPTAGRRVREAADLGRPRLRALVGAIGARRESHEVVRQLQTTGSAPAGCGGARAEPRTATVYSLPSMVSTIHNLWLS